MRGRKPASITTGADALRKVPAAPAELSADARAEWRRAARILVERRHLTAADLGVLESYCIAIGLRDEARRTLGSTPMTYVAGNGLIKAHPAVGILKDALAASLRHAAELGLTIVSRSRVTIEGEAEELGFLG